MLASASNLLILRDTIVEKILKYEKLSADGTSITGTRIYPVTEKNKE